MTDTEAWLDTLCELNIITANVLIKNYMLVTVEGYTKTDILKILSKVVEDIEELQKELGKIDVDIDKRKKELR